MESDTSWEGRNVEFPFFLRIDPAAEPRGTPTT
jgi:hypothetical protein